MVLAGAAASEAYRIGGLILDVDRRLLTRGDSVVTLPPKTFDLLVVLVRRAPGVVTRQELLDSVWPQEIVNDEALTQRLMLLRRALGDDARTPRMIASVPRWGYRLVCTAERLRAAETEGTTAEQSARPSSQPAQEVRPEGQVSLPWVRMSSFARRTRAFGLAGALVIAVAAGALVTRQVTRPGAGAVESIAILPFAAIGGDEDTTLLATGISESVTCSLSRARGLRVISAATMGRFAGGQTDPQQVGGSLGVEAVLVGHLLQRGDTFVLTVELVDVKDGTQLWGEQYTRHMADVFVIQEDLSAEIAAPLHLRLSGAERNRLARGYTGSSEAYRLYLQGRRQWNQRTPSGFSSAIDSFRTAVDLDPGYALAHAGLADCYVLLGASEYGAMPPSEAMPRARAAAIRALEIDHRLAEAHASLGLVARVYDWDREAAERELRVALELAPSYATAHQWYGELLAELGRLDDAEAEIERAHELDPLSPVISADRGLMAYYRRRGDLAVERFRETLTMEPGFIPGRLGLALAEVQLARFDDALTSAEQADALSGRSTTTRAVLAYVLARAGRRDEAAAILQELLEQAGRRYVPAYYLAGIEIGLDDSNAAFAWLERARQERSSLLGSLAVEPVFDPLRDDPRFDQLLLAVGLADQP